MTVSNSNSVEDIAAIRAEVKRVLQQLGPISGAQLGTYINLRHPHLKRDYGGLRLFVNTHCPEVETLPFLRGPDHIYRLEGDNRGDVSRLSAVGLVNSVGLGQAIHPQDLGPTPWQVFTNPSQLGKVWVNDDALDLKVTAKDDSIEAPWRLITSMTDDEHRQICREYLPEIPGNERVLFSEILSQADFWPRWQAALRTQPNTINSQWSQFRFRRIGTMFLDRLRELGLPEDGGLLLLDRLRASKVVRFQPNADFLSPFPAMPVPLTRVVDEAVRLRKVISAALERLSLEELRRITLPIGIALDVEAGK